MTRKDFFVLTFSLVGSAVVASNCSSNGGGKDGGTGGSGSGGMTATGGRGGSGSGGAAGSGSGGSGTGGSAGRDGGGDAADTGGAAGADGGNDVPVNADSGNDVGGGDTGTSCTLPLPEEQLTVAATDNGTHVHALVVQAATLNATTQQMVNTGLTGGHMHAVTFSPTDLTMLRGGGTVTILSALAGNGTGHTHTYRVSCFPLPDAGGGQ